ncbi:nicotinate-nucleotide pyrophosphorylase [carboxylating] isoform X2 [Rhineura floridana]|uniref:nicotinate-nucleotide pyrophosphorylase [carboxylating] isoform X2 n=1 Tax=Rhineura floridana TaxID=261503 RepID=UPI002AC88AD8|nr:nicotinate-nucleotide pyrophosphorylase [carboxylating] isoform X2 [Rhineura floridana]
MYLLQPVGQEKKLQRDILEPGCSVFMASQANLSHLLPDVRLRQLAHDWLREDTPSFDYAGYAVGDHQECAVLLCKSPGVLAGFPFFEAVFAEVGCTLEWLQSEGAWVEPNTRVAEVCGRAKDILLGERVALNCIGRCSGIATSAAKACQATRETGWHGEVAGTRKTTPGFRLPEKYGLLVGGASCHRYDLGSLIMLKDNHVWASGGITQAVRSARRVGGFTLKVEVECRSLEEALEAGECGADIIMLDNFAPQVLSSRVTLKVSKPKSVLPAHLTLNRIWVLFKKKPNNSPSPPNTVLCCLLLELGRPGCS